MIIFLLQLHVAVLEVRGINVFICPLQGQIITCVARSTSVLQMTSVHTRLPTELKKCVTANGLHAEALQYVYRQ